MQLVDYTHPDRVPQMFLPLDRRSAAYYLRLYDLPEHHPYYSVIWPLFRYPAWLEGGTAWLQATYIAEDIQKLALDTGITDELCPLVGSADPGFDEALAQSLATLGLRPRIAEVFARQTTTG